MPHRGPGFGSLLRHTGPVAGPSTTTDSAAITVASTLTPVRNVVASTQHFSAAVPDFVPLPLRVHSPVNVFRLAEALRCHTNHSVVNYLLHGFSSSFDIGLRGTICHNVVRNLQSATSHSGEASTAIHKELSRGHTSGPFATPPIPYLHCSPLGAVPKKNGTFRIILELFSPSGSSVNDGISQSDFSVHYSSFDDAVDLVRSLGHGFEMAKVDKAFRLCPVRPQDYKLLGMFWQGSYYVDTRFTFWL